MQAHFLAFAAGFPAGLLAWTFLEYVIHAWLGHLPKGRILTSREHLRHHADILYFTPLPTKLRGAVPVLAAAWALAALACGWAAATGFVAALALGWTVYERLHQSIHVHGPRNSYSRWAARHHLAHHFGKPNSNHGVTSPLWDILLGTHHPVTRVSIKGPQRDRIPWLRAWRAADGPDFLADYDLA